MNKVHKGSPIPFHDPTTSSLVLKTRVIQHMLRNNVTLKDEDWVHIAQLISIVTYFILFWTQFDVVNLLICYIDNLTIFRNANYHKKPNLTQGHLIAFILKVKYNITFGSPLDHIVIPLINKSLYIFYGPKMHSTQGTAKAKEEKELTQGK